MRDLDMSDMRDGKKERRAAVPTLLACCLTRRFIYARRRRSGAASSPESSKNPASIKNPSIPGPKSSKMSRLCLCVSVSLCLCHFFYELKDAFFKRKRLRKKKSGKSLSEDFISSKKRVFKNFRSPFHLVHLTRLTFNIYKISI